MGEMTNTYIEGVRGQPRLSALMKRETGENPVRTRHCDKGVPGSGPLNFNLGRPPWNEDLSARRPA